MALSQPPPELEVAISNASQAEGVPSDLLAGIWRVETGSRYPNPFRNSSGYGGDFGTADWNGPVQEQANLAAQILHNQLVIHHGNVAEALSAYSGGGGVVPPPRGYSSVPGETTFGVIDVGQTLLSPPPTTGATPAPQASSGPAQNVAFFGNPFGSHGILNPGGIFNGVWGVIKTPFDLASGIWGFLTSSKTWIRIGLVVGGFLIIIIGIAAIAL